METYPGINETAVFCDYSMVWPAVAVYCWLAAHGDGYPRAAEDDSFVFSLLLFCFIFFLITSASEGESGFDFLSLQTWTFLMAQFARSLALS